MRVRLAVSNAAAVVVGATISGVIGILVIVTQQSLVRRHELSAARIARLSDFAAQAWTLTLVISQLARAPLSEKQEILDSRRILESTDAFNSAMAKIQLLESGDVFVAAHAIDRCLVYLTREARSRQFDREEWKLLRSDLSAAVDEYQQAARVILGSGQRPNEAYSVRRRNTEV